MAIVTILGALLNMVKGHDQTPCVGGEYGYYCYFGCEHYPRWLLSLLDDGHCIRFGCLVGIDELLAAGGARLVRGAVEVVPQHEHEGLGGERSLRLRA